jgi:hypothetical protein
MLLSGIQPWRLVSCLVGSLDSRQMHAGMTLPRMNSRPENGNMLKHVAAAGLTRFNEFVLADIEFIRWACAGVVVVDGAVGAGGGGEDRGVGGKIGRPLLFRMNAEE